MADEFKISWSSHLEHISSMLHTNYLSNSYTDVTLVCSDKIRYEAHRLVLSSCSYFFKDVITPNLDVKQIIYLKGIESIEMKSILQFMYYGETDFQQNRTYNFLQVAKELELKGVSSFDDSIDTTGSGEPSVSDNFMPSVQEAGNSQNISEDKNIPEDSLLMKVEKDGNSPLLCLSCSSEFPTAVKLKTHCVQMHKNVPNICTACGYQATDIGDLKTHKISMHHYLSCVECDFLTIKPVVLKIHQMDIHENVKYDCDICNWQGGSTQLYNHRRRKHGAKHQKKLMSYKYLKKYQENINQFLNEYICKTCDLKASCLEDFEKHNKEFHSLSCHICQFTTHIKVALTRHIKISHNEEKKYYMKIVNDIKEYFCKECEYQNPKLSNMRKHVGFYHLGIKYPCDQCSHLAQDKQNLDKHIRGVHNKELRFSCDQCEKKFSYLDTRNAHVRSYHTNQKFSCKHCNSKFGLIGNLTKHMKNYHQ